MSWKHHQQPPTTAKNHQQPPTTTNQGFISHPYERKKFEHMFLGEEHVWFEKITVISPQHILSQVRHPAPQGLMSQCPWPWIVGTSQEYLGISRAPGRKIHRLSQFNIGTT